MDEADHFLPGLLRYKGKGAARCVPPCVGFLFLLEAPGPASAWVTRSSQEAPSPTLPSIQDDSTEPSDVIGPLTPLFPVAPGATAPHLLDLCCCWSVLWLDQQPLQVRAVLKLLELVYLPMVVALGPDPSCEQAKSFQVVARAVHEALDHIAHVTAGLQFFDVQPLALLFFHRLNELVLVAVPLTGVQGANLECIKASDYVHEIPLPPRGNKVHEVLPRILAGNTPSPLRSSGGGPILPCSGMRGLFPVTSLLPGLWSSPLGHTLTLASCSFSLGYERSKPHLPRWVYHLLIWGGWMCLLTS